MTNERFIRHSSKVGSRKVPSTFSLQDWLVVERAWLLRRDLQRSLEEWAKRKIVPLEDRSLAMLDHQIGEHIDPRLAKKLEGTCFSVVLTSESLAPAISTVDNTFYLPTIYPIEKKCEMHADLSSGFIGRPSTWSWLFLDSIDLEAVAIPRLQKLRTVHLPILVDRYELFD